MTPSVTLVASATSVCLATHGMGPIQVPHYRVGRELASGRLVEVLADYLPTPLPIYLLHQSGRQPSQHLRQFIDWTVDDVGGRLKTEASGI